MVCPNPSSTASENLSAPVIYSILYSDATGRRGMDKNIGEQLNKAYEAFRQACMDRDSAVKELQQKVCGSGFESYSLSWYMEF
nr:TRAF family member-associated NF-kappa-B activator-like [Macaca nemestrina]